MTDEDNLRYYRLMSLVLKKNLIMTNNVSLTSTYFNVIFS